MSDKNKEQIMDELFVLASEYSKIMFKGGFYGSIGALREKSREIPEDQIKYFLLQEYYFAAPFGIDQYTFFWFLVDTRTNKVDEQVHELIKDYNYDNINDPDNKNKKSFFDLNPIVQDYWFNKLGKKEINDIINAIECGNLDLFYKLSPIVQRKILALDSCLAEKISNMNEWRKSEFKGRAAEEVKENIDGCYGFYKFEQNLYREKDKIYNDSKVLDGGELKYFYKEDAKGVIDRILHIDPKEIDKLLELGLKTSKGERIKIKDALAMIVEMFPILFFKLPIEIQDKILDHKYEQGLRSVRESMGSYLKTNNSLYHFLLIVTDKFLTEDDKKLKKEMEEPHKTDNDNKSNSEKKENPVEKPKPLDNQESKSETKLKDDKKKEIPVEKSEGKEKQEPIEKPNEKNNEPEIIDKLKDEDKKSGAIKTDNRNKKQIMSDLFALANRFSKDKAKMAGEANKKLRDEVIEKGQIKYFALEEYYFALPYGFDQYEILEILFDRKFGTLKKQILEIIKDYNYKDINDPDNKNKKSFFDLNPVAQYHVFLYLDKTEIKKIINAIECGNLDLFYKLTPLVQKKILALDSCLAEKISDRNEWRKSEFKGRTAEEVRKIIDGDFCFWKLKGNLLDQKDKIDNFGFTGSELSYFPEEAKEIVCAVSGVNPDEIDKLLELEVKSEGGKKTKIKDALAMAVVAFPVYFFELPIEIQDRILDINCEPKSISVREGIRFWSGKIPDRFLFKSTNKFLTEGERECKKQIKELFETNNDNKSNSEKKENPVEKPEPLDNQESKSETKLKDDKKKEIPVEKFEGKEKQEPIEKPNGKDNEPEIIDEFETKVKTENEQKQRTIEKPNGKNNEPEIIDKSETEAKTENENNIKKEIVDEKLEGKKEQEPIKKTDGDKVILPKEELNNKIESIISQVDKPLKMNENKFSLEEIKSALETAINLLYSLGRFGKYKVNKSKYLEEVRKSDKITIRNFLPVFFTLLFDPSSSLFDILSWKKIAFDKNRKSLLEKLKELGDYTKAKKNSVPNQSTDKTINEHNKFIEF